MDRIDDLQLIKHHSPNRFIVEFSFATIQFDMVDDIRWILQRPNTVWSTGDVAVIRMQEWII